LRLRDATGQIFQSDGIRLVFNGWRWLTFSITTYSAHWGGTNNGVKTPPLYVDTLLLLDHVDQDRQSSGTVRFAGAMAISP
jgi:hypothetical protein